MKGAGFLKTAIHSWEWGSPGTHFDPLTSDVCENQFVKSLDPECHLSWFSLYQDQGIVSKMF